MRIRLLILSALLPLAIWAQNTSQLVHNYMQAENAFRIGRFDEVIRLLDEHLEKYSVVQAPNVYRLLALCYLQKDDNEKMTEYVVRLLKINPFYTANISDPPQFVRLIEELKQQGSGVSVSTASLMAENLNEAPVPVTVITKDMIRQSGARNLQEALLAYVPGMTLVESNGELNLAMRGVYSDYQNKVLIMLDGHRLNSYSTNTAAPDFSISLEKVRQIEVLRGPASSVYGDAALAAVVNVLTEPASDVGGIRLKGKAGNHGMWQGDFLLGKQYVDLSVLGWASMYHASGEKVFIPAGEQYGLGKKDGDIIIGGFNSRPSHDVGVKLRLGQVNVMYNNRYSKTVMPFSTSYFCAPYSYDRYRKMDGELPGKARNSHHLEMSVQKEWTRFMLKATATFDTESQRQYDIVGDSISEYIIGFLPTGADESVYLSQGVFRHLDWTEKNIALHLQAAYRYAWKNHKGTVSGGVQGSRFSLDDSYYVLGGDYDRIYTTYDDTRALYTGNETSYNAHLQVKHQWKDFILNLGLRYDYKYRFNNQRVSEFSPRFAAIYLHPRWEAKFTYAHSYVDAPYFFRNNSLDTGIGGAYLGSEYLDSYQLTFCSDRLTKGLSLEATAFYNHASDFVIPKNILYVNAGRLDNVGVELTASYGTKRWNASFNATWQQVVDAEDYRTKGSYVYNIPKVTSNLIFSCRLWGGLHGRFHLNYQSKQWALIDYMEDGFYLKEKELEYPARIVCNAGLSYQWKKWELTLDAYNLFDKKYEQGGSILVPVRQKGRWLNAGFSCRF